MADWRGVSEALSRGYIMGRQSGGRLSVLGKNIATLADRLRSQREAGEEQGRKINLLGIEGLIKGIIEPAKEEKIGTTFNIPGLGGTFKPKSSFLENVTISPEGELAYKVGDTFIPLKSISKSGLTAQGPPKEKSYSERKQDAIQAASLRIQQGETVFEAEKKNLLSVFPDMSWDTLENLREIGKIYKPEIVKRQQLTLPQKSSTNILENIGNIATLPFKLPFRKQPQENSSRNQAIQELRNIGYPITENNIKSAIQQLQGQ